MKSIGSTGFWTSSLLVLLGSPGCDGGGSAPAAQATRDAGAPGAPGGTGGEASGAPSGTAGASGAPGAEEQPCGPVDPELADGDVADLFGYPHVPAFDFYLPVQQWEDLQANAREEQFTPVQACFEGKAIGRVGLRFKGYYGTLYNCFDEQNNMICPRLSMKVKFSEYDTDLRFYGLKRLNFNAYRYDDTRMHERLTYDLYRAMGVVAPRASWAVVRVNGESYGVFGMVEQVDGRFTADRWPDNPDGNLYKEVWPSGTSDGQALAGLETNEETGDASAFAAFVRAMDAADDDELRATLGEYTDLAYLARYMAVDDAVANYDGITYFWTDGVSVGNHNYYFYEEGAGQFTLIPWDVESSFWINPDHAAPHWTELDTDCSLTYPYWDGLARAPGCDRVIRAMAADLEGWRSAARELLDGPFSEAAMLAAIDEHAEFIRGEVEADPTPLAYGTFEGSVETLRSVIPGLRARLEGLLAGDGTSP